MGDKLVTSGDCWHIPSSAQATRGKTREIMRGDKGRLRAHHPVPKLKGERQQDNMMEDKTGDQGRLPAHKPVAKPQKRDKRKRGDKGRLLAPSGSHATRK